MRYSSNFKQPTGKEQALIRRTVRALVKKRGSVNAAARRIGIDSKYLGMLMNGKRKNPGDAILSKLGLRRITYIEEKPPRRRGLYAI